MQGQEDPEDAESIEGGGGVDMVDVVAAYVIIVGVEDVSIVVGQGRVALLLMYIPPHPFF